jgi:hypothetical protein
MLKTKVSRAVTPNVAAFFFVFVLSWSGTDQQHNDRMSSR